MPNVPHPALTAATPHPEILLQAARLPRTILRAAAGAGLAALASVALTACGAGEPPQLGDQAVNADAMQGLLRVEDIAAAGGDTSRLRTEVEDVLAVAEELNPEQSRGVTSWHAMKVKRGRSTVVLIFTVVEFTSAEEARVRLSQMESGLGFGPMDVPVADGSSMLSSSSGTGLAFVKGNRTVTIQTVVGDMAEPILDDAGVEQLARVVAERL